jgi:His-Xaa-Ser system protein HxsD
LGKIEDAVAAVPSRQLVIDLSVYTLDTLKKAAYRFLDRLTVDFEVQGNQTTCTLHFARGTSDAGIDAIMQDFRRELLDQDLRQKIAAETAPIRNAILALAFAPATPPQRE